MPATRPLTFRLMLCRPDQRASLGWLLFGASLLVAGCATQDPRKSAAATAPLPEGAASAFEAAPQGVARFGERDAALALVDALDARLAIMRDVAATKWQSGAPIADPAREAVVLEAVSAHAAALGLDAEGVRRLFELQIRLARELQQRWHEQWRADGTCAPCQSPRTLEDIRTRIDAANERELRALCLALPGQIAPPEAAALAAGLEQLRVAHGLRVEDAAALLDAVRAVDRSHGGSSAMLARIRRTGLLRIGTTGDYAPFSLEAADGRLSGADVDLAVALACELGVTPVFVRTSWSALARDLAADRFDVAVGGISYTDERAAIGAFSRAYHEGGKTFVARCDECARYETLAEVDRPGVRVVVNPGGTNERYVREHLHAVTVLVHADNRTVFDEIVARRADVMVTDDVEADLQALRYPGELCRPTPTTLTRGEKRILMRRDPGLQQAVDAWLVRAIDDGMPAETLRRAMRQYASPQGH